MRDVARRAGDCALAARLMRDLVERFGRSPELAQLPRYRAPRAWPSRGSCRSHARGSARAAPRSRLSRRISSLHCFRRARRARHCRRSSDFARLRPTINAGSRIASMSRGSWAKICSPSGPIFSRLVRAYDLPPPAGYATMDEFNAELQTVLASATRAELASARPEHATRDANIARPGARHGPDGRCVSRCARGTHRRLSAGARS